MGTGMGAGVCHWRSRGMIRMRVVGCTLVKVRILRCSVIGRRWRGSISIHALWTRCVGPCLVRVVSLVTHGCIDKLWLLLLHMWWLLWRESTLVVRREGTRI